jgi:hypothetical protein
MILNAPKATKARKRIVFLSECLETAIFGLEMDEKETNDGKKADGSVKIIESTIETLQGEEDEHTVQRP